MPDWVALSLACAAVAFAAWAGTGLARALLVRFAVYDRPTPRSSHGRPTPRGAGFALVPVLLAAWWTADRLVVGMPGGLQAVLAGALVLFLVSAWDDLRSLPPAPRFAAQVLMVGLGHSAWVLRRSFLDHFAALCHPTHHTDSDSHGIGPVATRAKDPPPDDEIPSS